MRVLTTYEVCIYLLKKNDKFCVVTKSYLNVYMLIFHILNVSYFNVSK